MSDRWFVSWPEIDRAVGELAGRHLGQRGIDAVYGIPRGGVTPAVMVAQRLGLPMADVPTSCALLVDDLVDSGATAERYPTDAYFDALFRKSWSPPSVAPHAVPVPGDAWVVFPWEGDNEHAGPTDAVVRLLEHVGEDPNREGLADTPERVLRSLAELTAGYGEDPQAILGRTFAEPCDEMVVVRGIDFVSVCEHHMLPFVGTADVAYVPGARIAGLSKVARLVDCFARRLQLQERMTQQIADALLKHLDARGVGVVVRAHHSCMGCRGVRKPGAEMVTSALYGYMKDDDKARAEFLALARAG